MNQHVWWWKHWAKNFNIQDWCRFIGSVLSSSRVQLGYCFITNSVSQFVGLETLKKNKKWRIVRSLLQSLLCQCLLLSVCRKCGYPPTINLIWSTNFNRCPTLVDPFAEANNLMAGNVEMQDIKYLKGPSSQLSSKHHLQP